MSLDAISVAIGAIPSTVAAYAAVIAARRGTDNRNTVVEIRDRTAQIERQTNGEMERKIRQAVIEVFKDHQGDVTQAVMAESVRHLLNAMIGEETPYPDERKKLL